jgi:AbrB family looped-hinge helix DNA binding protein
MRMATATLTSKGQITLPAEVRRELDLDAGDKVDFVPVEGGGFRLVAVRTDVRRLKGRFAGRVARPVTVEEMEAAVAAAASEGIRRRP